MNDLILKDENGFPHLLKARADGLSFEQLLDKLTGAGLPVRMFLNEEDIKQIGDWYNKANCVPEDIEELYGIEVDNPVIADVFRTISTRINEAVQSTRKIEALPTSILTKGYFVNSFKPATRVHLIGNNLIDINIVANVSALSVSSSDYHSLATISSAYSLHYPNPENAPINSFSAYAEYWDSSGEEVFLRTRPLTCTMDWSSASNVNQIKISPGESNLPASVITARLLYPIKR